MRRNDTVTVTVSTTDARLTDSAAYVGSNRTMWLVHAMSKQADAVLHTAQQTLIIIKEEHGTGVG